MNRNSRVFHPADHGRPPIATERPNLELNATAVLAAADSMTCCEFGAYWRLILKSWLAEPPCTLTSDDGELAKVARLNPSEWAECRTAVLAGFTTISDGRLLVPWLRAAFGEIQTRKRIGRNRKRGQRTGGGQGLDMGGTCPGQGMDRLDPSPPSLAPALSPPQTPSLNPPPLAPPPPGARAAKNEPATPGFDRFWASWPAHTRKVNRKGCVAIWKRDGLEPQADPILASLARWRASRDWCKDGGDYIPLVATWLNQERWKVGNIPEAEEGEQPAFLRVPMSDERAAGLLGGGD